MLSDAQDEALERLQSHALKCIFGPNLSARKLRELAGVTTLRVRRIEHCDKFARKCAESDRFSHWFPRTVGRRSGRNKEEYKEEYARCKDCIIPPSSICAGALMGRRGVPTGREIDNIEKTGVGND